MQPIGQLKASKILYCTICSNKIKRTLKVNIYKNTDEEIQKSKIHLTEKINKEYTCRICKSIKNSI